MILQPFDILIQGVRVQRLVIDIQGEHDFVHVLVERFLLGTEENNSRVSPVSNPEGNVGGRFCKGSIPKPSGSTSLRKQRDTGEKHQGDRNENKSAFHGIFVTSAQFLMRLIDARPATGVLFTPNGIGRAYLPRPRSLTEC